VLFKKNLISKILVKFNKQKKLAKFVYCTLEKQRFPDFFIKKWHFFALYLLKGFSCRVRPQVESITRRRGLCKAGGVPSLLLNFKTKTRQKSLFTRKDR
jgi:hypothetical protein